MITEDAITPSNSCSMASVQPSRAASRAPSAESSARRRPTAPESSLVGQSEILDLAHHGIMRLAGSPRSGRTDGRLQFAVRAPYRLKNRRNLRAGVAPLWPPHRRSGVAERIDHDRARQDGLLGGNASVRGR